MLRDEENPRAWQEVEGHNRQLLPFSECSALGSLSLLGQRAATCNHDWINDRVVTNCVCTGPRSHRIIESACPNGPAALHWVWWGQSDLATP